MMDAGMSSFTLPELIDWWNFRSNGIYVNRKFFPERDFGLGDLIDPFTYRRTSDFLGEEVFTRSLHAYSFGAWRFEKYNAGVYKNYSILSQEELDETVNEINLENNNDPPLNEDILAEEWQHYNKNPDASIQDSDPYSWENLDFDSYTNKTFDRKSKELVDFPELKRKQNLESRYIFQGVVPANLIAMNDYYNLVGFGDTVKDFATQRLLKDIRRSKNAGYISWSGKIPLFINVFENGQKCISEETFNFKLYLFDKKKPLNNSKSQVFPSITLATNAIGPDGTNQKDKVDGDSFAITDGAPNKKVGGKLKTSYRAYDGTFSAGSEQIYGIVVSDTIPAVEFAEDMVDWAENMDIEQHFKDPVNNTHLTPSSGLVIPIDMQNANPFQWSPNYANPKGCRGDNKEKVTVNVFNMSTKEFTKGETVLLTDRYSLWFIDPISSGAEPPLPLKKTVGKWQFTYHMTNQDFFYRFADPSSEGVTFDEGKNLNPKVPNCMDAEEALSRKYLAARNPSNYKTKYGQDFDSDSADDILERDAGKAWAGYAQVTSWDFMGKHLCGLRERKDGTNLGNALVLTQTTKDHRGEFLQEFNNYGVLGGSRFTTPFFGCAFPGGYQGEEKYLQLNEAVKDGNNFTGKGFYVNGQPINQTESFFNQSSFLNDKASNTGTFDPSHDDNNISTNTSPLYFFKNLYPSDEVKVEPHCNIFSSEENFFHLPADIGVNGSFNADYGGPILSLNNVQKYLTTSNNLKWATSEKIYGNFHDFWQDSGSFQWLYNAVDSETKQETNNPDDSTFNIKPTNPNRIQFRPLTDSVFAQFDPPQVDVFGLIPNECDSGYAVTSIPYPAKRLVEQGFNNYPEVADGSPATGIIGSSKYGVASNNNENPLWGLKTKKRLISQAAGPGGLILRKDVQDIEPGDCEPTGVSDQKSNAGKSDVSLDDEIMPFKYNAWYVADEKDGLEWDKLSLSAWYQALDLIYPNYTADNHYGARRNSLSRGAYGVIGAVCTSEMQAGVQIQTDNTLGQPHNFLSNVFYASWGARQDLLYNDPNTTALFVKIYEAWPRDQTIFDSRFYAVHHFNEGNKLPVFNVGEDDEKRPWQSDYKLGPDVNYGEKNDDDTLVRPDENPFYTFVYDSGVQQVSELRVQSYYNDGQDFVVNAISGIPIVHDKIITNVDHKIPSIFSGGEVDLEVTNVNAPGDITDEDLIPSLDSFGVEELLKSEKVDSFTSKMIFSEGITLYSSCNYVVDGDVVKNLDRHLKDKFGEDENFNLTIYRNRYSKYTPLAPTSLWKVDPNRRARLLPWIYNKHDMGLGYSRQGLYIVNPKFINFDNVESEDRLERILDDQTGANIIVADKGTGYKVGNIFTVSGGSGSDVQMRVSEIGADGEVEALEWIFEEDVIVGNNVSRPLWGYGFLPSDFLSGEETNITSETQSNIRITPVGNVNTSFKAFFVAGYTSYNPFIDRKPQVVTEIKDAYRVSAPNNKDGESGAVAWRDNQDVEIIPLGAQPLVLGDGTAFQATPGGLENTDHVVGTNTRSINLNYDREKSNPNVLKGVYSKYDMFFHFHCDTSHQWIESDGLPLSFENLIDMEIFPF